LTSKIDINTSSTSSPRKPQQSSFSQSSRKMARGNQRDKAREKNLKEQAGKVRVPPFHKATGDGHSLLNLPSACPECSLPHADSDTW